MRKHKEGPYGIVRSPGALHHDLQFFRQRLRLHASDSEERQACEQGKELSSDHLGFVIPNYPVAMCSAM
jgi:hypothetical protein